MKLFQAVNVGLNRCLTLGVISCGMLIPSVAHANLYTGTFNATGRITLSLAKINFTNQPIFAVGTQDTFTPAIDGTKGTFKAINVPPYTINTVFSTPNFLTFAALPGISFTLTKLDGGTFGTAGCATAGPCNPAGMPYDFYNQGTSAVASFTVEGFETDGVNTTPFTGIFSETFPRTKYASIVTALNAGKTVETTYSASFDVADTPEPAFLLIPLGAGLLVMFAKKRRDLNNAAV